MADTVQKPSVCHGVNVHNFIEIRQTGADIYHTCKMVALRCNGFVTSAEEGGYVFGAVCLSVCLSACPSDYSQTCERILTKFFGGVGHGSRTK